MSTVALSHSPTIQQSQLSAEKGKEKEKDSRIQTIAAKLEVHYTENNVYKSIVFCSDDDDVYELGRIMSYNNHSVCTVTEDDLWDDRDSYITRIKEFNETSYRIIIVSATVWSRIIPELEVYVLPEQNLVVFSDMDDFYIERIRPWLSDAHRRGFIVRDDCEMLFLSDD